MEFNDYKNLAKGTKKPWENKDLELSYYGLGLAGEAGEVTEIIKKNSIGSKKIVVEDLKKELGDVLWYVSAIADYFDFDLNEVAQINIDKLKARHGEKWSGYGDRSGKGA